MRGANVVINIFSKYMIDAFFAFLLLYRDNYKASKCGFVIRDLDAFC